MGNRRGKPIRFIPLFEFKAMKANEKDFYSFYVLCHVYTSFIPLVQLNVLNLSLLRSFIFLGGCWGLV